MTGAVPDPLPGWLTAATRVTALTGAGISTDSGIPDYRGPQGVWTRDPDAEKLVTLSYYMADPEIRRRSWLLRRDLQDADPRPNAGHAALVDLERQGRLRAIVTQNIDGLHQAAGSDPDRVLEIHGTVNEVLCTSCGDRTPMREALDRVAAGEPDPSCRVCGGILKSATIYFGQMLEERVVDAAVAAATDCDVLLAVGTSLTVHPAAGLVDLAARSGARVVVVNAQPTPYDDVADLVVQEPIGTALPRLLAAPA
ncbi:NAD-dependent protein deacylase [Blastococcus sp. TF02A-35]|uniref:SIR2 family NAD-dependent protein deacylase n=1 Tax=Blastococcus sp. TF02A-35 TaxID=2559612 RepID=UPI00107434D1|nr:NAD-dependent protein deacylase [Blastococcus sp. TF02A_35]TFV53107.1 NAD-dependent protein deacylase [Blastococcus sp. TF02A_35]